MPATRLAAFRILVCLVALYDVMLFLPTISGDAAIVSDGGQGRPWTPLYYFEVLGVDPSSLQTVKAAYVVAVIALLMGAVGLCTRVACAVGAILFFYWSGLLYSFGKPHHDKVALAFAIGALPFARVGARLSVDAWLRRRWFRRGGPRPKDPEHYVAAMPIRLVQITLAIGYGGAGLSKLFLGGFDWFNGYTLQGIMLGHDGYWSRWVAQSPLLCQIQSVGVVSVQALFPVVLFWPKARWFFLPAAMGFHLMTWMTMDTGPYMRVWLMLFAFVALERVPAWLRRTLASGVLPAAITVVLVALLGLLVGFVARHGVPIWSLVALAVVLLLAFARSVAVHGWNSQGIADTTPPK